MLAWALTLALFAGVSARSSRIVGGEVTTVENFPSIVQIDSRNSVNEVWQQSCGGSIITNRDILSAGSCLLRGYNNPRLQRIRAGATYRNAGGVIHYIDRITIHPTYLSDYYTHNIGIARLATSLSYTPTIQRTAIPPQGTVIPDGLPVTQVGWGRNRYMGEYSNVLRYVDVLTVNFDVCAERYSSSPNWPSLRYFRNLICTGLVDAKGVCFGDHGGPLLYGNVTIGVIYDEENCGTGNYPALNTHTGRLSDWIVANAV